MKKFLRLLLLAALMVPLGARATTDTLTVADGSATSSYLPIYGLWADADQHNQMIYPASMLTEMIGQNIIGLNFTISGGFSCNAVVSMAIVPDSTLSGIITDVTLVQVWSGDATGQMMLEFTNAFAYSGGNLLIDIQTEAGSYSSSSCTGISRTGAAYYSYNGSQNSAGFLPQATFIYSDAAFCNAPMALTFDGSTTESISFHWTPGSTETMWEVMVGDSLIENVTDTFLTVTELNASSRYAVKLRSICGADDTSAWTGAVMMQTTCAAIATLPWSTSFEGEGNQSVPLCWTLTQAFSYADYDGSVNNTPFVYDDYYYAHSGTSSLQFSYYGYYTVYSDTALIASPFFAHNPADLHVSFWIQPSTFPDGVTLEAGIMTDPNDATTFVPLSFVTVDDFVYESYNYSPSQFEFYTSSLTDFSDGDSVCIAFRMIAGDASSIYIYLDDIIVDAMGDCLAPVLNSGNVDSVSYEAVQLSWVPANEATDFVVKLVNVYTNATSYYTADDSTLLITGLPSDTYFEAYVATLCGDDTTSFTFIDNFTTHLRCYSVQNAKVAALTANAAALAWSFTGTGIEPASVELVLTDLSDSDASPVEVSVVGATNHTFTGLIENHMYQVTFTTICGEDGDTSSVEILTFMPHTPPCAEATGNGTSSYVPFYSLYNNGVSQSLYDAALIEGIDTITGITLEVANALNRDNLIDIYMGYTSLSNLTSTDYVPFSQLTHVVSDYSLNTGAVGETDMIPFDTVFLTQPTGDSLNLIIAFYNHTGSYTSGLQWATHESPIGTSVYGYTDSPIDITNPWSMGSYSIGTPSDAPNVQFYGSCGGGDCLPPSVTVSETDTTSATLTWLPGGSESSWVVQYREGGSTTWLTAGTAIAQPYTVTGLNAGTDYQFRLGSDCGDTVVFSSATSGSTACGQKHAPFGIFPTGENNCWTFNGDFYYSSGSAYSYMYSGASIVTPAIADSINTLQVKLTGYGANFYVGACDEGGANPEWIDTVSFIYGNYDNFETRKSYLYHYTGTKNHIIIKAPSGYDYVYMSNITVEPLDDCMPVENLQLDSVTTTEAWISWISDGSNFQVKYMAESDVTGTWLTTTTTTNSAHLTGLNSNDRYQIKVFNVCSATSVSDSVTFRFATGCVPYPVPYSEYFGQEELPVCWNNVTAGTGTYTWSYTAQWGYNYIYSEAPYNGTANDWLMTPVIQMPASADYYQLIYYAGGAPDSYTTNSLAAYEVRVSTTGSGDTSAYTTLLLTDTVNTYNTSTYNYTLNDVHLALAAYAGQQVSFAFVNRSRQYGTVYLANVEVREAVNPVYYITGNPVVFTGETNSYIAHYREGVLDSMTLNWTSTMAAAGQATMTDANTDTMSIVYTVSGVDTLMFVASNQYGADTNWGIVHVHQCDVITTLPWTEDFEDESALACWRQDGDNEWEVGTGDYSSTTGSHSGTGNALITHQSRGDVTMLATPILNLSGASTATMTFWHIQRVWSGDQDTLRIYYRTSVTSDWVLLQTYGDDISTWTEDTIILPNTSSTYQVGFEMTDDYGYGVAIDDITIMGTAGASCDNPILSTATATETTATFNWASAASNFEVAIVEGAWVAPASGTTVADTTYTFTGLTGSTQYTLGVRAVCGEGNYSDWVTRVVTTEAHPCYAPTAVTATNPTFDGATIAWTVGEEGQSNFELHITAAGVDTLFATTSNPVTVTGLPAATAYTVTVRAICGEGDYSEWSTPANFSTATCQMVEGVRASATTATTATITWTANGSSSYEVAYGITGTSRENCRRLTANTNSITINGLDEATTYDVYVRSVCTAGVTSDWSDVVSFETQDVAIDDVDNASISLYPNPASSTVTLTGIEGDATVTVVDMNGRESGKWKVESGKLTIDVTGYAQGAYFVRITGERVNAIRKLIVR